MKLVQRFAAFLLTLVILIGLLPQSAFAAEASTYDGNPTADVVQAVIDYGKTVEISLPEVKAGIHVNRKGSVGALAGFVDSGSSGELLSVAPSMICNGTGKDLDTTYGTATWEDADTVSYTPDGILSDVDYFYAVYALTSSSHAYIKVEIQIIPASMMYYEAEELVGSGLDTYDTTNGPENANAWGTELEGGSANDSQTYDSADLVSSMIIDRKQIPGGAFFADFTSPGTTLYRYTNDPVYGGRNFDKVNFWKGNGTDSVENAPGTLTLALTSGNNYHYLQTTTDGGGYGTTPLSLRPTVNDYFQVRFRMENCEPSTNPTLTLYFIRNSDGTDVDGTKKLTASIPKEQLDNGEYVTITIPMNSTDYTTASAINLFRFNISGVPYTDSSAKMIVDYVYLGDTTGIMVPKNTVTADSTYMYFGFDSWTTKSYYNKTVYGKLDYSSTSYWYSDSASTGTNGTGGVTINTDNTVGYLYFKDGSSSENYNFVQPGESNTATPLRYTTTGADVFRIRFKIKDATSYSGSGIRLEYRVKGGSYNLSDVSYAPKKTFTYQDNTWIELQVSLGLDEGVQIYNIRPCFYKTQGGKFYIDYIYIGDAALLYRDSYFFADFTNTAAEQTRNLSNTYNNKNYDVFDHWSYRSACYSKTAGSGGTVVLKDTMTEANETESYYHSLYIGATDTMLPYRDNMYMQMRVKIQNATIDSNFTKPYFYLQYKIDGGNNISSSRYDFTPSQVNGKYITATVKLPNQSGLTTDNNITQMLFVVAGTQGATITIDYVYCGPGIYCNATHAFDPTVASNPASKSLYFDFDNSRSGRFVTNSDYALNDTHASVSTNTITEKNYDATASTWTLTNGSSVEIDTTKGILSIKEPNGPTLTAATLRYHPYNTDALQVRFRLNGCTAGANPRVEARLTGYLGTSTITRSSSKPFGDTNNFQTILLPLSGDIMKCTTITKMELQFYDIQGGTLEIDKIYVGDGTVGADPVYGYDGAYTNDTLLSDGESLFVEGKGVKIADNPTKYTEASFSFTGTGFDIISRTGKDQGAIRVEVVNQATNTVAETVTVNNKGELELYQIPVVSVNGLPHGNYKVTLWVNKKVESPYPFLVRGDDFYLDAIRIYDPIDVSGTSLSMNQQAAKDAYRADREAYSYVKEIRDSLLSLADFDAALLENGGTGAVFVDSTVKYVITTEPTEETENTDPTIEVDEVVVDHRVVTAADYKSMGPNNEVYLAPGQAVAFKLEKDTTENPVSVDVGAKTVLGDGTVLSAGFVTAVDSNALTTAAKTSWNVNSASAQYFPLDESALSTATTVYLVVYNAYTGTDKTKNILSITDLKVCYAKQPTRTDLPQDTTSSVGEMSAKRTGTAVTTAEPYSFVVDGRTLEAAEVFLNGIVETPVEDATPDGSEIHIYHSLNLASDISMNYMVPVEQLANYDSFQMELRIPVYEGNTLVGYRTENTEAVEKNGYYYFTLKGMTAVHMSDDIEATLFMTKEEVSCSSYTDFYSIASYAYAQLRKDGVKDSLKTLCADLLVYGAKAQTFKGYRTDNLADWEMTEEERAYSTDLEAVTFGNTNAIGTELEAPTVTWVGKVLDLASKINVKFVFAIGTYAGEIGDLSLRVTYEDIEGNLKTLTLTNGELYNEKHGYYAFTMDMLLAAELRSVLSVQVYEGETPLSCTLQYSPDTYGNNKTGTLLELCKALFAYSDSAKAFFG